MNTEYKDDYARCSTEPPKPEALQELPTSEYETEFAAKDKDRAHQPPRHNANCRSNGIVTPSRRLPGVPNS
jgi:hypothetical protein